MSEQRLIDANALKEIYEKWLSEVEEICYQNDDARSAIFSCICQLEEAPTIEAEPVRHGKWTDPEDDDDGTEWHCSECGSVVKTLGWYPQDRFCHNCGARMDKEEL